MYVKGIPGGEFGEEARIGARDEIEMDSEQASLACFRQGEWGHYRRFGVLFVFLYIWTNISEQLKVCCV